MFNKILAKKQAVAHYYNMNNVGVYKCDKYTAYIYPSKIIICTARQSFVITTVNIWEQKYIKHLSLAIIRGRIKRLDQFRDYDGALRWQHTTQTSLVK